jgi:hypothetical protein
MEYLEKKRESAAKLRDEMNKYVGDEKIIELRNKRGFLQNIVITSATLLGFVSAFSTVNNKILFSSNLFIIGVASHLFLICFITLYLRETIDKDIEGLIKLQDRYNEMIRYEINLTQQYLLDFINDQSNIFNKFKKYQEEILNSDMAKNLRESNEKLNKEEGERKAGKVDLEYNGEIAVFCFVFGTILIFLSILSIHLTVIGFIFLLVVIIYFTCTDNLYNWSKYLFKFLTFLTRKDILKYKIK